MWQFLKNSQRFKTEVESWVTEGILQEEQALKIKEKYGLNASPPWYKQTSFILQIVAWILATMGFFLLIGMNWEIMPTPIRTMIGLLPLLISYGFAWKYYQDDKIANAEVAMVLASMLFGANIVLQAQIYHISGYAPDGVLWWILGALPVMYFFRSNAIAIIFQGLFMIWLNLQTEYNQFSVYAIGILFAFTWFLYKNPNPIHLVFALVSIFLFLSNIIHYLNENSYTSFAFWVLFVNVYVVFCLAMLEFIKLYYSENFIKKLQNTLATMVLVVLYSLTFENIVKGLLRRDFANGILFFILALYGLAIVLWIWKNQNRHFYLAINFVFVGLFLSTIMASDTESVAFSYFIVFNLLLLAFLVYKIYTGILEKNKAQFMWGIAYLLILALSRYVNLFGDNYFLTGMLFIGSGFGILGINKYWNKNFETNEKID